MKKTIAAMALATLTFGVLQQPVKADQDDWFKRHDRNNDQRWNYNEFKNANRYYYKNHHDDNRWNNKEVREHWNGIHKDGYVTREQVHELHHWDN
jgi:hypothetical protein